MTRHPKRKTTMTFWPDEESAGQEALRLAMLGFEADVIRVRSNWPFAVVFPIEAVL